MSEINYGKSCRFVKSFFSKSFFSRSRGVGAPEHLKETLSIGFYAVARDHMPMLPANAIGSPQRPDRDEGRNRCDAAWKLLTLVRNKNIRQRYEQLMAAPSTPQNEAWKKRWRMLHKQYVGVEIEQSHQFHAALSEVAVTGEFSVESLIERFAEAYRTNGSSGGESSAEDSGSD